MPAISPSSLEAGDVLLSLGVGKLSDAIRQLDGGQYSHAAIWTGSQVLEATLPEVMTNPLERSLENHPRVYVDAYRHADIAGKSAEVVRQAEQLLGRPYAKGDLLLLTALVATAAIIPGARRQHGWLMVANGLDALLSGGGSGAPADDHPICTELVVRSYAAAKVPIHVRQLTPGRFDSQAILTAVLELVRESTPRWRLPFGGTRIAKGFSSRAAPGVAAGEAEDWAAAQARLRRRYEDLTGQRLAAPSPAGVGRTLKKDLSPLFEAGESLRRFVTPRYLETSPDLTYLGRVYGPDPGAKASSSKSLEKKVLPKTPIRRIAKAPVRG